MADQEKRNMLNDRKIGFIGGGNMAEAMIKGLLHSGASRPENIIVSDVRRDRLNFIKELFEVSVCDQNTDVVKQADLLVLAVKPQIMETVLLELADHLDMSKLIISIAAGVSRRDGDRRASCARSRRAEDHIDQRGRSGEQTIPRIGQNDGEQVIARNGTNPGNV